MIADPRFSEKTVTVGELNATVKACIGAPLFQGLEVFGEVSGASEKAGHLYFTLKDETAAISCICFGVARTYRPRSGESVVLRGRLDYYEKNGKLSFIANTILPVGEGALALKFERLKKQLEAEGLFDPAHKKPIPEYASEVLVLTSRSGAVIRDIVTTVRRKNPVIDITLRDVRVQGEGAAHELVRALERVDKLGYDVIIIARGGGSLEDLAPFYDEELVRAVYAMRTPVVSAIGHETDFSLLDLVADARAATPTAAAELVAYDYYSLVRELRDTTARLKRSVGQAYARKRDRLRAACFKVSGEAKAYYGGRASAVWRRIERVKALVEAKLNAAEGKLGRAADKLRQLYERGVQKGVSNPEDYAVKNWIISAQGFLISCATFGFTSNYDSIMDGSFEKDLFYGTFGERLMDLLGDMAYRRVFTSRAIYRMEVHESTILNYLMDRLIYAVLHYDEEGRTETIDRRIVSFISDNYKNAYRLHSSGKSEAEKIYLRLLLVTDYVCGMTDSYAKRLYQEMNGIL